jgi:hypothetical protein
VKYHETHIGSSYTSKRKADFMNRSAALRRLANSFDKLLVKPRWQAELKRLAMECLLDDKASHVLALQFPCPKDFMNANEPAPLQVGQMVLALAALHKVYCEGVEPLISLPPARMKDLTMPHKELGQRMRWDVAQDKIETLDHEEAEGWFRRLLLRVKSHLKVQDATPSMVKSPSGRRKKYDAVKYDAILRQWQVAKRDGLRLKDFCKREGITPKDVTAAQGRLRSKRTVKRKK